MSKNHWAGAVLLFALVLSSAVQARGWRVIEPERTISPVDWTEEERAAPSARRLLLRTDHASHHLMRLAASEVPHVHNRHDLTVFLLAGRARIHLPRGSVDMAPGDVLHVPRGTPHWAEVKGRRPVEVHATFAPALDGRDYRKVEMPSAD